MVIAKLLGDTASSQRLRTHYIDNRSFIYLPVIIAELENYKERKIAYYDAVLNAMDKLKQK